MSKHAGKLSRRYAEALFALAEEKKISDKVFSDLSEIVDVINSSKDLEVALANPVIPKATLHNIIIDLLDKIGTTDLIKEFCKVLCKNRRLVLLSEIVVAFEDLLDISRGEVTAEIISYVPLEDKYIKVLGKSLGKSTGKKVKIKQQVNTDILGGIIVKVGSKMLDDSVHGKLERMRAFLKG